MDPRWTATMARQQVDEYLDELDRERRLRRAFGPGQRPNKRFARFRRRSEAAVAPPSSRRAIWGWLRLARICRYARNRRRTMGICIEFCL